MAALPTVNAVVDVGTDFVFPSYFIFRKYILILNPVKYTEKIEIYISESVILES